MHRTFAEQIHGRERNNAHFTVGCGGNDIINSGDGNDTVEGGNDDESARTPVREGLLDRLLSALPGLFIDPELGSKNGPHRG